MGREPWQEDDDEEINPRDEAIFLFSMIYQRGEERISVTEALEQVDIVLNWMDRKFPRED